jgi:hypothetical protein
VSLVAEAISRCQAGILSICNWGYSSEVEFGRLGHLAEPHMTVYPCRPLIESQPLVPSESGVRSSPPGFGILGPWLQHIQNA